MRKLYVSMLCVVLLSGIGGCAARAIHPGAVNKYDSAAFDILLIYHDAIESAKTDLTTGVFPVTAKPALNALIDGYDTLQKATTAYHAAALAGRPTASLLQDVTNAEAAAAAAYAEFVKIYPKGGTP